MSHGDEAACTDLAAACAWGQLSGGLAVIKGDALFPRLQKKGA
jgi:methionyl-tRNA synthetase